MGGVDYPKNLTEVLDLLKNFKPLKKTGSNDKGTIEDEQVTGQHTGFAHVQAEVPKKKQQYDRSNVDCFACGNKDHMYWKCSNVSSKMNEMIIKREKKKLAEKNAAGVANLNTQAKEYIKDDDASEGAAVDNTGIPLRYHRDDNVVVFRYYRQKYSRLRSR